MSEIKPIRIERSRKHKQITPNGLPIVYVGRPSVWGNPFRIGGYYQMGDIKIGVKPPLPGFNFIYLETLYEKDLSGSEEKPENNEECVSLYRRYIKISGESFVKKIKEKLKGKNLSCWCKLGEACHADVLLEIANS
jgi:hypothetical protein